MSAEKTRNAPQDKVKQTQQLRLWLIVGGIASSGMGVLNILSAGHIAPYDGGQILLGLVCLGYALTLSKKISRLRAELRPKSLAE